MTAVAKRKYMSINDISREILPLSKKRIRAFVRQNLPVKIIGGRIFVERSQLEKLLSSTEQNSFPIAI